MKLSKKQIELKDCLNKEWILTNGTGGFCTSTVVGANTRRYHGLLVAPLIPPAQRHVLLSKVDESIVIDNQEYNLFTNVCKNYISDGYKYLECFEKEFLPIFTYKVNDVKIVKTISMVYGRNTVVVQYKIKNGKNKVILKLAPIVNFRDFHQMNTNHNYSLKQKIDKNKIRIEVDGNASTPIYLYANDGRYIEHNNDKFNNMYYLKEDERGFFPEEDLIVPGRYEIEIAPKESKEITFVASLEDNTEQINASEVFEKEINRLQNIIDETKLLKNKSRLTKQEKEYNELMKNLIIASDSFIINRPTFGTHSVIAGFPWFLDWGRDTLIAFEGLLLITKRYDLAKEILLTFTRDIKYGLVPNGYSGFDNRPLYNSADASLLLFEQVNKYLQYTKDYKFVKENLYEKLKEIIENYSKGINLDNNNIFVDKDGLLCSGTAETQNTWMDAKIGDYVVTPRNGKVVEINALWYNALKTLENLSRKFEEKELSEKYKKLAMAHKKEFTKQFYNKKRKSLYDVIGDSKIRPNQLFSISLTYPILEPNSEIATQMWDTVTKKLLNKYGLKTLAKGEENYIEIYEGDPFKRDMSYHQGITWTWLLGLYFNGMKNRIKWEKRKTEKKRLEEELEEFRQTTKKIFVKELTQRGMIGSLSELHDSKTPYAPKGAPAQGWSVSEIFRIIL